MYDSDWLYNICEYDNLHLEGRDSMKLEYEGSAANIAMHVIEQAGYGR